MKILGLIPARGGSKGVPGKNIKSLNGQPLINYTIEYGLRSNLLADLIVSTDDDETAKIAREAGASVPFIRPEELGKDSTSTLEVVIHAIDFLKNNLNQHYDLICLLQPTTPFRSPDLLINAVNKFQNENPDSLFSVKIVPDKYHPDWVFIEDESSYLKCASGKKEPTTRRQDLKPAYYRDGALYLTRTEIISQNNSLYGEKISFILHELDDYVNIDTLNDWEQAEMIIKNS